MVGCSVEAFCLHSQSNSAPAHQADSYAASLGQAEQLAEFLDLNALPWDLPIPFVWLTEASHPPTEHRIDRLYRYQPPIPSDAAVKEAA